MSDDARPALVALLDAIDRGDVAAAEALVTANSALPGFVEGFLDLSADYLIRWLRLMADYADGIGSEEKAGEFRLKSDLWEMALEAESLALARGDEKGAEEVWEAVERRPRSGAETDEEDA